MNLFRRLAGLYTAEKMKTVEAEVVQEILQYMCGLTLPYPQEKLRTELYSESDLRKKYRVSSRGQWYLLAFGEKEDSALNAGYALKQGLEFLRSRRIPAKILRRMPDELKERHCIGILAVGTQKELPADCEYQDAKMEHFLICQKNEEHWSEELVLAAEKLLTPDLQTKVQIVREEKAVHLVAVSRFGKNQGGSRFYAGVVLGALMAAAEELWLDVEMVDLIQAKQIDGSRYFISICRKRDLEELLMEQQEKTVERSMRLKPSAKEHQWKYA